MHFIGRVIHIYYIYNIEHYKYPTEINVDIYSIAVLCNVGNE